MQNKKVIELIRCDIWSLATGELDVGAWLLRFRTPVLDAAEVSGYHRCLRIVWRYAESGIGALPGEHDRDAMETFENRICDTLERDGLAVLVAVFTFDGGRQWVFYSSSIALCGERINSMPQEDEPYPIEIDTFDDPSWGYLREEILPIAGSEFG